MLRRLRTPRKVSSRESTTGTGRRSRRVYVHRGQLYMGELARNATFQFAAHVCNHAARPPVRCFDQVGLYCYCLNSYVADESRCRPGRVRVNLNHAKSVCIAYRGEIPRIMNRKTPNCCGIARGKADTFHPSLLDFVSRERPEETRRIS